MLIVAAAESSRGWGGPIGMLVAIVVFVVIVGVIENLPGRKSPSPEGDAHPDGGVKSQVTAVSDTDDTGDDTPWWGSIRVIGGRRVRVAGPPVDAVEDEGLDVDEEELTIEEEAAMLEAAGVAYMEIVRRLMDGWRVSEATAKRAIRAARAARVG